MKISNSYSDCFYQVRYLLRERLGSDFKLASLGVHLDVICQFADDLTAFNEVSGLPFFVKFERFSAYA